MKIKYEKGFRMLYNILLFLMFIITALLFYGHYSQTKQENNFPGYNQSDIEFISKQVAPQSN